MSQEEIAILLMNIKNNIMTRVRGDLALMLIRQVDAAYLFTLKQLEDIKKGDSDGEDTDNTAGEVDAGLRDTPAQHRDIDSGDTQDPSTVVADGTQQAGVQE